MLKKIFRFISLDGQVEDMENIHQTIEKGVDFKGTNLWILVFAIFIASVGLNMNSTAVIIGAMLISPLMGPITGMGYSIATYDFPLFRQALKNFGFAVAASLITSTVYFSLSPVSTAYSELLARTSPTIYDVLIALFGGLAGIVAISTKNKGNVIPGVAIATALMPPLCTAGFGLATGSFGYFFGALYLFAINTVFIAFSSTVICQVLKFPIRTSVEPGQKKRINRLISVVILVTVVPSVYFGNRLVQNEKFNEKASRFVTEVGIVDGNYLLDHRVEPGQKNIQLIYGGNSLTEAHKTYIRKKAEEYELGDARIDIEQGFSFENARKPGEEDKAKAELNRLTLLLDGKTRALDSAAQNSRMGKRLLDEIVPLYPEIDACSYAKTRLYQSDSLSAPVTVVGFSRRGSWPGVEKERITGWLKKRLPADSVKVYFD